MEFEIIKKSEKKYTDEEEYKKFEFRPTSNEAKEQIKEIFKIYEKGELVEEIIRPEFIKLVFKPFKEYNEQ